MRLLSIAMMMLAWLAYGTMFAWAGCPMCASMNQPAAADMSTGMSHQAMADMEMGNSIKASALAKSPCEGGGMTHMPLCSACLVVPVDVIVHDDGKQAFSYPSPAIALALPGARPAPLAPPPRPIRQSRP
ncbi:hypothetical protein [Rhizobium metallidurans]|uniref:DUF2946 domain-containing protein n=1 Tax=Rhizobium metallidurans TaxID=1265931 RepID=A0A7W6GCT8_9HYPH|nr:hypothetical protein [Rhizobium metallidurans]MBB3966385.1 hypothetical protein [Rhizobium metallidurans]